MCCLQRVGPRAEGYVLEYRDDPLRPTQVRQLCCFCVDENEPGELRR